MTGATAAAPGQGVTALDVVTLMIAVLGAITGVVALVLQQVHFRRAGARIAVELRWAYSDGGASVVTIPMKSGPTPKPPTPAHQEPLMAVVVRNRGRAAATVEEVGIRMAGGLSFHHTGPLFGTGTPHRLESETSQTFYIGASAPQLVGAMETVDARKHKVSGYVNLGSGRVVRSKAASISL